jgi:hypothetical protein
VATSIFHDFTSSDSGSYLADVYTALAADLTTIGWSLVDASPTRGSGSGKVWKSPSVNGVYFYVLLDYAVSGGQQVNQTIGFDYDVTLHDFIGTNISGAAPTTVFTQNQRYLWRVNQYSIFLTMTVDAKAIYVGLSRAMRPATHVGTCLVTPAITVGTSTFTTNASMVGLLTPGMTIALANFGHSNGSANKNNRELLVVSSVTATQVVTTAGCANAYDAGCRLGVPELLLPQSIANIQATSGFVSGSSPINVDSSSVTGQSLASTTSVAAVVAPTISSYVPGDGTLQASISKPWFKAFNMASSMPGNTLPNNAPGIYGIMWSAYAVSAQQSTPIAAGTKYTDGQSVYYAAAVATADTTYGMILLIGPTNDTPNFATQVNMSRVPYGTSDGVVASDAPSAPTITNITPAAGSLLPGSTTPLQFEIDGLTSGDVIILAYFGAAGVPEVVRYNGAFTAPYAAGSTYGPGGAGQVVVLNRISGWPGAPTIIPIAFNGAENA